MGLEYERFRNRIRNKLWKRGANRRYMSEKTLRKYVVMIVAVAVVLDDLDREMLACWLVCLLYVLCFVTVLRSQALYCMYIGCGSCDVIHAADRNGENAPQNKSRRASSPVSSYSSCSLWRICASRAVLAPGPSPNANPKSQSHGHESRQSEWNQGQ